MLTPLSPDSAGGLGLAGRSVDSWVGPVPQDRMGGGFPSPSPSGLKPLGMPGGRLVLGMVRAGDPGRELEAAEGLGPRKLASGRQGLPADRLLPAHGASAGSAGRRCLAPVALVST